MLGSNTRPAWQIICFTALLQRHDQAASWCSSCSGKAAINPSNGCQRRYMAVLQILMAVKKHAVAASDLSVACSDDNLGGKHHDYDQMLAAMEHSKFCLVLPGDSQSTRRLSEIFMAGDHSFVLALLLQLRMQAWISLRLHEMWHLLGFNLRNILMLNMTSMYIRYLSAWCTLRCVGAILFSTDLRQLELLEHTIAR